MDDSFSSFIDTLRALAEPTRIRLAFLCSQGELTVSELTKIIGHSQPRISRHLRVLQEAKILERFREHHWVLYRLATSHNATIAKIILNQIPKMDAQCQLDQSRLSQIRQNRALISEEFMEEEIPEWLELHRYHGDPSDFSDSVIRVLSPEPIGNLLDIATGTGRMLKIIGPFAHSGVGIDLSKKMVAVARLALADSGLSHLTVRQDDMYQMKHKNGTFDTVTLDQVLYFASDPQKLLKEATRVLRARGRILIIAFTGNRNPSHPNLEIQITEIYDWLTDCQLTIELTEILPGDYLDISLLIARK